MSYTLGDITLPNPKGFTREQIEVSVTHVLLDGTTKKDIFKRKEKFLLIFEHLTQSEITSILSEYNLQQTRNFAVSETNLTITSTSVHIEISPREYMPGSDYRERMELILTEVD